MSKKHDGKQNDQNLAPQTESEDLDSLKQELEDVKTLASRMETQLKRAVADYQNLEKRVAEGRSELTNWAATELIRKLLSVLHNFEQVILGVTGEERDSAWFKGVELAVKQFQQVLQSEGLEEIATDGQFDPALHEAVDTTDGEDGKIMGVVQKGYTLNGKVLQPAKVVVGRKEA